MKIKNYTSGVPISQTIYRIEQALIKSGVSGIGKEYDGFGGVSALTFVLNLEGHSSAVRLDPKVDQVQEAFWSEYQKFHPKNYGRSACRKSRADFLDQAQRTAWKLLQDWIEVELSRVALRQGEFNEIFLSQLWNGKETSYQYLKRGGFRGLLPEKSSDSL